VVTGLDLGLQIVLQVVGIFVLTTFRMCPQPGYASSGSASVAHEGPLHTDCRRCPWDP
jgi:hypothetical protein